MIPVTGPKLGSLEIPALEQGVTIGRHERCDVLLPVDAEMVSRVHARFDVAADAWRLTDLASRWGTFLNGVRLSPNVPLPLDEGDLIRIAPWTFSVSRLLRRGGVESDADAGSTTVHTFVSAPDVKPRPDLTALLLEGAAAIHSAQSEKVLAERIMDVALRGTGLTHAALVRLVSSGGRIEPIAWRPADADGGFQFSRSLIAAAAEGRVARLDGAGGDGPISESMVQMRITAALCVPLMLGESPAALLYLDARGPLGGSVRDDAAEFCVALGRIGSLALANLKRIEIERRSAEFEYELNAAATAQRWVLPPRSVTVGRFRCLGESRAGQYVGGDFFDVIDLGSGRLGLALGDVSGKGISAGVLMTATQGFLNASLSHSLDPGKAVSAVNRFIYPRRPPEKFVTMWVGVFDAAAGTLRYIDAGHGFGFLHDAAGRLTALTDGDHPPVGFIEGHAYTPVTIRLEPGGKVVVVSDGIIEQPGARNAAAGRGPHFEVEGVHAALTAAGARRSDEIAALFEEVIAHAGTDRLADDATAVTVRW